MDRVEPAVLPRSTKTISRRPPASSSVSLRHSPPAIPLARQSTTWSSPNAASDIVNPPSSITPDFLSNKHSSGESSDAAGWFETTNNNAEQNNSGYVDHDPPFFLRNSSSADTPPDVSHGQVRQTAPHRPALMRIGTDVSSAEDFRSVIDDLTVANKKLRQRLKKYERMHNKHLEEEKLFEVKFHHMPDHKKKELEETLRKFASELDDSTATTRAQLYTQSSLLERQHTKSSSSRAAESGYASMYASGPNSSSQSNPTSHQDGDRRKPTKSQSHHHQQQSIQSYLHDVPARTLSRNKAPMTEQSKKKLVVRRLEQIFAGKQPAAGGHQQLLQQEEVAQSAATADRREREATGVSFRPEGLREAYIMPRGNGDGDIAHALPAKEFSISRQISERDSAVPGSSPNQRPTRPIDLDPSRAQVSAENMEYIRHLGFTPPDMASGESPTDGHGWIYLNLIINMAQLHTLNVTPEFVKIAVQDYSSHMEVSPDGRKIRWTGGLEVTRNSGGSSSEHCSNGSLNGIASGVGTPAKHGTTGTSSHTQADSEAQARKLARARRQREQNKFAYRPLFFHKDDSDEDDDLYSASFDDTLQLHPTGNSSGVGSSAMQSHSSKPRHEDGPIIFYTKAKFCTDLSGDRLGAFANMGSYKALTSHPLGATPSVSDGQPALYRTSTIGEARGPMNASPMDIDSIGTHSSSEGLGFSPEDLQIDSGFKTPDMVKFEASGVGGVQPEDNFSIHVRRSQITSALPTSTGSHNPHAYSQKILDMLADHPSVEMKDDSARPSPHNVIKEEFLSATRRTMPNSTLPPASLLPFDSTSSGDVDSDLDSDTSSDSEPDASGASPTNALQPLNIRAMDDATSSAGEDSDVESDFNNSDDDDGSIDLLATARQLDPATVRAFEREYDAGLADRLAEEIRAGSSAATAGGGSGFNSPAAVKVAPATPSAMGVGVSMTTHDRSQSATSTNESVSSCARSLKRMRTSESVAAVVGKSKRSKSRKIGG